MVLAGLCTLVLAGCSDTPTVNPSPSTSPTAQTRDVVLNSAKNLHIVYEQNATTGGYTAKLLTNNGTVVCEPLTVDAPKAQTTTVQAAAGCRAEDPVLAEALNGWVCGEKFVRTDPRSDCAEFVKRGTPTFAWAVSADPRITTVDVEKKAKNVLEKSVPPVETVRPFFATTSDTFKVGPDDVFKVGLAAIYTEPPQVDLRVPR